MDKIFRLIEMYKLKLEVEYDTYANDWWHVNLNDEWEEDDKSLCEALDEVANEFIKDRRIIYWNKCYESVPPLGQRVLILSKDQPYCASLNYTEGSDEPITWIGDAKTFEANEVEYWALIHPLKEEGKPLSDDSDDE